MTLQLVGWWVLAVGLAPAAPPTFRQVIVDPWRVPALVRDMNQLAAALQGVQEVQLLVFSHGQTAWPTAVAPFAQAPCWQSSGASLAEVTARCRAAGVRVSWVLDLLQWERAGLPPGSLAAQQPQWFERNEAGTCAAGRVAGRYASPWSAPATAALSAVVDELAGKAAQPDGWTLQCRLSSTEELGFSAAARLAYIRAKGVDPVDLSDEAMVQEWAVWREQQLSALLRLVAERLHQAQPAASLTAWASGAHFVQSVRLRARAADNWLLWLHDGLVTEVLLDGAWDETAYRRVWHALDRLQQAGDPALHGFLRHVGAIVASRDDRGRPTGLGQAQSLIDYGGPLERLVWYPLDPADLAWSGPGGETPE